MTFAARHAFVLALAAAIGTTHAPAQAPATTSDCDRCGKVESVHPVTTKDPWTPLGTTASGVAVGNPSDSPSGNPTGVTMVQIGKGMTKKETVLIGAAGGGMYRTRPPELNAKRWEVVVRMDNGERRSVTQNYEPMLRDGDRVRVLGTQLELMQ